MTLLAIYDMDQTVTRRPTFTSWLWFFARQNAPWRLPLFAVLGLASLVYLVGARDRLWLKAMGVRLLMGRRVPRVRVVATARAYADRVMAKNLLADAVRQIAADKAEGRRVVLATASLDFYVAEIARRLGLADTDVIATAGAWEEDTLHARVAGANVYDLGKLSAVEAWLARHGLARARVHARFYSDHVSDAPTFAWADEAVAVNPGARLAALAGAKGWRVVRWG